MADLMVAGLEKIHELGSGKLPFSGISIYSKSLDKSLTISSSIEGLDDLFMINIKLESPTPILPEVIKLIWKVPAINLKGSWSGDYLSDRRVPAEWEGEDRVISRTAFEAPVFSLFGHDDQNVHTFACSDAINTISLGAGLREEDVCMYCVVRLFSEPLPPFQEYELSLRLDYRDINYAASLRDVSIWWASFESYRPMSVPEMVKMPMYSTWYSYHQEISPERLVSECRHWSGMGYKAIIVNDGWQTADNRRGYGFTGDWKPERFPQMREFVDQIHQLDMKVLIWYSIPFIGKHSQAFKKFGGKYLKWSEEWQAAIADPRYPEIREHVINIYIQAVKEWDLDGLKLDFVDHFLVYEDTELTLADGRDYASVNQAVDRLMMDISTSLTSVKPGIMIKFRQHYMGPTMRKYGNIFRAHDCPNDSVANRRRVTDLRLLSGDTAVHSDMLVWNYEEPVELAALQFLNILFSVPQVSVRYEDIPKDHQQMVNYYSHYWLENRHLLLNGEFYPQPIGTLPSDSWK